MSIINVLHDKAIEFSELATIARRKGNSAISKELFFQAFQLEKEAALNIPIDLSDNVPRHIFLCSAASLAIRCEQFKESAKLIAISLYSSPPVFIIEKLNSLSKELKSRKEKDVQLKGIFNYVNAAANEIKIQDSEQSLSHTLIASSKIIKEIVKKHFLEKVDVNALLSNEGVLVMKGMRKAA